VTIFDGVSPQPQVIGRLKLVNPEPRSLSRAADGLFESQAVLGSAPLGEVRIKQGFLEGSNVSVAASMVALVSQQRMFDLNIKMVQNADTNARSANGIMSLSRG
jgi:flagellar basal-body rod protein FlgF